MENINELFETFKLNCEVLKNTIKKQNIPCIVECKLYDKYNWFCGTFMVDKFGGTGAIVKYYNSTWFINEEECNSELDALMRIPEIMVSIYKNRNLKSVYDNVNNNY